MNRLLSVSMPRSGYNQMRTFTYDPSTTRLATETHPETGTTSYTYAPPSAHGAIHLDHKIDANNQQTQYFYDIYDRPTKIKFLKSGGAEDVCQQVNYTYDTYPAGVTGYGSFPFGRMTTSQVGPGPADTSPACQAFSLSNGHINQNFLQAYSYSNAGQITGKRLIFSQIATNNSTGQTTTGNTWDTSYTYDDEGYQKSVTYPMGQTHLIGLDFLKRPYSLTYQRGGASAPAPIIQSVAYNPASQMTEMVWADNANDQQDPDAYGYPETHERREYNSSNQLTRIDAFAIGQPNTVDLNYQYIAGQNNGQVASLTDNAGTGRTATYTYDPLMRLASVSGQVNQAYSYDGWGNLYSRTGTGQNFTLSVDATTNRVSANGICYDPNGNMTAMTGTCSNPDFAYNINNRLVWAHNTSSGQEDSSSETYVYTADNKRVSTIRPNGTTAQVFFIYGAKSEVAAVCTSQLPGGAPVCEVREPRDMKFAGRIVRQNYLPATVDRLGSVVSPNQGPSKNFAPFGEQLNATQAPNVFPGNTGFATYWGDTSTGLNYANQRFYSANYARFMSADPYRASGGPEDPGSWNRYAYVEGDSVNEIDPSGRMRCIVDEFTGNCVNASNPDGDFGEPGPIVFGVGIIPIALANFYGSGDDAAADSATQQPCDPTLLKAVRLDYSQLLYKKGTQSSRDHIIERHDSGASETSQYYAKIFFQISNINRVTYLFGKQTLDVSRGLVTITYSLPQITPGGNHIGTDAQGQETATNKLVLKDDCKTVITSYPTN